MSLLCHGAVLIPLAHISGWSATPPRYSMQRGGPASPSLRASLAAPGDAADLDGTQVVVSAISPSARAGQESLPLQPKLAVLPEAKVLARIDFKTPELPQDGSVGNALRGVPRVATNGVAPTGKERRGGRSLQKNSSTVLDATPKPAKASKIEPTATVSHKPARDVTAGSSNTVAKTVAQANRAHPQPTRHAASHGRGSTGTDAVTAAGSAGNSGGGQVDQAASPIASNPVPPYPSEALARGVEGLVLLRVRIGADGRVEEARIQQSSGTPLLDESALSTVRQYWRFEPATRGGVAVSYEAILPIRFTIRAG
jgi:TonB family protein